MIFKYMAPNGTDTRVYVSMQGGWRALCITPGGVEYISYNSLQTASETKKTLLTSSSLFFIAAYIHTYMFIDKKK